MPRKKHIAKREPAADPIYENSLVTRFVNSLMTGGKRSTAERIFYGAMKTVETRSGQDAMTVLKSAMNNVKPVLEVKSRRVGGANYQVPVEVRPERRTALAIRWLITFGRGRWKRCGPMFVVTRSLCRLAHTRFGALVSRRGGANSTRAHWHVKCR